MAIYFHTHYAAITGLLLSALLVQPSFAAGGNDLPLPLGCTLVAPSSASGPLSTQLSTQLSTPLPASNPPVALQIRTSVEPTMFVSGGRQYLIYELDLQNYSVAAMNVRGIDVMEVSQQGVKPIATIDAPQLNAILRPTGINYGGYNNHPHTDANRLLDAGRSAIAFMCIAFDGKATVPTQLRHRVHLEDASNDGPVISVQRQRLPVFGAPLTGSDWHPYSGPNLNSHHRMGVMVVGGVAQNARRFAVDWLKVKNGELYSGDPRDVKSYFGYGEKLFAVADGTVVEATDMYPDNIPKTVAGFEPALPITMENVAGNRVVIALANGQFAQYMHMQPGSVRVKRGDRVQRGQWIGQVGNSGDSRKPHLHFQLVNSAQAFAGEGMPFVIDHFQMKAAGQEWTRRNKEFPWGDDTAFDFGSDTTTKKAR